ncbi:hypothetical protein U879_09915 [Defluviimonas sp. 20V17]|uniref:FMN-binding domain-containing protein n=1 Tax=Allgaiera indica TaxID=765699 RepID=A0AAN4UQK6_9RHOB|nr:hypothetical protein [Allgaiera indica]KDB03865.1 hypothetical protein U879_09915 [Defluviimonas sp. 20V17]GHE00118.1 hypothetical protein GCM10008024_10550 [Allgaiera indica]SDW36901.1 hypothetical protein SAMN05444006_10336 [Allgaiera indica]
MSRWKESCRILGAALAVSAGLGLAPAVARGLRDGAYTGRSYSAYYGRVQVRAIIRHGRLARVEVLRAPHDRSTSRYIARRALPRLEREVIAAQSTHVRHVSGASLDSRAYLESLQSALDRAL